MGLFDKVVVATDHDLVREHCEVHNIEVYMTPETLSSGTARCAWLVEQQGWADDYNIIVNIQGDEPFISRKMLLPLLEIVKTQSALSDAFCVSLCKKIDTLESLLNPNCVKVVASAADHRALYFSRSPIPYCRDVPQSEWLSAASFYQHIGLYAFSAKGLLRTASYPTSVLEHTEKLEQLAWLEHSLPIFMAETSEESIGVDTLDDLERARRMIEKG